MSVLQFSTYRCYRYFVRFIYTSFILGWLFCKWYLFFVSFFPIYQCSLLESNWFLYTLYLANLLKHLISSRGGFWKKKKKKVDSLEYPTKTIIPSVNKDRSISFCPICKYFIRLRKFLLILSFLTAIIMNELWLFSDDFCASNIIIYGFSYSSVNIIWSNDTWYANMTDMIIRFLNYLWIWLINYIDWFMNVKPGLLSWHDPHLLISGLNTVLFL